jgi:hypothetical protein
LPYRKRQAHTVETFDRLLRPIHCNERHAAAIPGVDRAWSRGQSAVKACDRLGVAAQAGENDAEQIERFNVLRFGTERGFAETLRVAELAGPQRRHRLGNFPINRGRFDRHFARSLFAIRRFVVWLAGEATMRVRGRAPLLSYPELRAARCVGAPICRRG